MRRGSALVAGMVVGVAVVSCTSHDGGSSARLSPAGRVEVVGTDGQSQASSANRSLSTGDRVRVVDGGGVLSFGNGRSLELRTGSDVRLVAAASGSELQPELLAGDALAIASEDQALVVRAGGTSVSVSRATARLRRGPPAEVGAYRGSPSVVSGGRTLALPALRQVSVPVSGPPPAPVPMTVSADDPWDQRFLGDAIQLGDELAARSRGFTGQLHVGEGQTPGFFRNLLAGLDKEPAFDATFIGAPPRPPGDTLVGLAIALEGSRGSFADRLRSVFAFHDSGASWGLVALDQGVPRVPLLARVDAAIGQGPRLFAEAPAPPPTTPPRRPTATRPPTGAAPPTTAGPTPGPGVPAPATSPPGPLDPVHTGVPAVDDTVNALVNVLAGLLKGLGRG